MTERGLAYTVDQACTQQWLAEQRQYPQDEIPLRPVLTLIVEFCQERLCRAAAKEDPRRAFDAICELRSAVATLVIWGHREFAGTLKQIDAELLFHAEVCKHSLLKDCLDGTPERAVEAQAAIEELVRDGYWDRFLQDLDDELWRRETANRERAC
jgi:hypothetical protein